MLMSKSKYSFNRHERHGEKDPACMKTILSNDYGHSYEFVHQGWGLSTVSPTLAGERFLIFCICATIVWTQGEIVSPKSENGRLIACNIGSDCINLVTISQNFIWGV